MTSAYEKVCQHDTAARVERRIGTLATTLPLKIFEVFSTVFSSFTVFASCKEFGIFFLDPDYDLRCMFTSLLAHNRHQIDLLQNSYYKTYMYSNLVI